MVANFREEIKSHLNTVEWVLKRKYEINKLQISFVKKKLNYKSITIYYYEQDGTKKELGKFGPNDSIPHYNFTALVFGATF